MKEPFSNHRTVRASPTAAAAAAAAARVCPNRSYGALNCPFSGLANGASDQPQDSHGSRPRQSNRHCSRAPTNEQLCCWFRLRRSQEALKARVAVANRAEPAETVWAPAAPSYPSTPLPAPTTPTAPRSAWERAVAKLCEIRNTPDTRAYAIATVAEPSPCDRGTHEGVSNA